MLRMHVAVTKLQLSVTRNAGLVNCTTIDWFTEWPADALYEVAAKQLADEDLGSQEIKSNMCKVDIDVSTCDMTTGPPCTHQCHAK